MSHTEAVTAICISASFTAEPLGDSLRFWANELGAEYDIGFAPYGQVFQQLLDPAGLLAINQAGANVVLVRLEDWTGGNEADHTLNSTVAQFVSLLRSAGQAFRVPLLTAVCPPSPAAPTAIQEVEKRLRRDLANEPSIILVSMEELLDLYAITEIHDPHADALGHVPYTAEFFAALGTMLVRKLYAIQSAPYKVIALDCDETLWRGICGEDGPEGIFLDQASRTVQEFMAIQRERGALLAIASRNNEDDVLETFRLHPEFPLRPEHFTARRINWRAKSANLAEIASELDLALDSFIFVDDNQEECAEVTADRPEVLVVPLPAEREEVPQFLKHVWAFDRPRITEEDRQRSSFYEDRQKRSELQMRASTLAEFITSLKLEVRIVPVTNDHLARISQLTFRTNQMNFTTIRRTAAELQDLIASGADCRVVEVWDRFGSYGLTGAVIVRAQQDALLVDTFLLSCRVLGRGVEHKVLSTLGEIAAQRNLSFVELPFTQSRRNAPAKDFLDSLATAAVRQESAETTVYRLTAPAARAVTYRPEDTPVTPRSTPPTPTGRRVAVPYAHIAAELRTVEQIMSRMHTRPSPLQSHESGSVLEQQVCALWAELLGVPTIDLHETFFNLGGHSLLAVQLLARARKMFGMEFSLEVVYDPAFTAAEMAKVIELERINQLGESEYASLLDEISHLSDEEVRALLAEGDAEPR